MIIFSSHYKMLWLGGYIMSQAAEQQATEQQVTANQVTEVLPPATTEPALTPTPAPAQSNKSKKKSKQQERTEVLKTVYQPYEHSPIYRTAEAIIWRAAALQSGMDRKYRYTYGDKLTNKAIEVSETVAWAYTETQNIKVKKALIENALRKTMSLLIIIRVGARLNVIKGDVHYDLVTDCVSIIKQGTGWINKLLGKNGGIQFKPTKATILQNK